jgi:transposase-like protein
MSVSSKSRQWLEHLAAVDRQGKSIAQYAREHGVAAHHLYTARYAQRRPQRQSSLVPVKISSTTTSAPGARVRASLPNGVVLEMVLAGQELRGLLATLASLPCSD